MYIPSIIHQKSRHKCQLQEFQTMLSLLPMISATIICGDLNFSQPNWRSLTSDDLVEQNWIIHFFKDYFVSKTKAEKTYLVAHFGHFFSRFWPRISQIGCRVKCFSFYQISPTPLNVLFFLN